MQIYFFVLCSLYLYMVVHIGKKSRQVIFLTYWFICLIFRIFRGTVSCQLSDFLTSDKQIVILEKISKLLNMISSFITFSLRILAMKRIFGLIYKKWGKNPKTPGTTSSDIALEDLKNNSIWNKDLLHINFSQIDSVICSYFLPIWNSEKK